MDKIKNKTKKLILKDRKLGMTIGELSWKYDLIIRQVDKICKPN